MKQILSEENSIFIAPFFILLLVFFLPISVSLKSTFSALSLVAIVLTPYYRHYLPQAFNTPWAISAVILMAYIIISSLWSVAPVPMRLSIIEKYSKLLYLPFLAVGFINPKTRKFAFDVYFLAMLITCFLSLLKHFHLVKLNLVIDQGEVFYNHIITGFLVSLAVYFAAILFLQSSHKWWRAYYLLMVVFGTYQVFFLNTGRTAYVIYLLLMSFLFIQKFSLKKAIFAVVLLLGSVVVLYSLSSEMQVRVGALINEIKSVRQHNENNSVGFRVQFHDYAKNLFLRHPIQGMGAGSFKHLFAVEKPVPAWDEKILHDPHSQYWLILSEQGAIGFILFLVFIGTLFYTAFKLSNENRPLVLGMLVAFCFGAFTDTILCYSAVGSLMIIICALGFGELIANKK